LAGLVCVLALGVMPLVGCSDSEGTGGSAGDGGSGGLGGGGVGGDGGTGDTAARFVSLRGYDPDGTVVLEGVELCELDTTSCVLTDAGGLASLKLPTEGEVAYTAQKEGWTPAIFMEVMSPDSPSLRMLLMLPEGYVAEQHERVGSPYPMQGTGTLQVQIEPDFDGVTLELMSATGTAWYLDEGPIWSTDLVATSDAFAAIGGFTEVTPGVVEVKLGGTAAQGCTPTGAWPAEAENTLRVLVREGYLTTAVSTCPGPQ
jgi:hypothetical protein